MKIKVNLIVVFMVSIFLSACMSNPLKAPCDQHPTFCGTKTKINQW